MAALLIPLRIGAFCVGATSMRYAIVATHAELSGLSCGLGARVCLVLVMDKILAWP